jgi:8-oxo-dGTP diphosphatase
MLKQVAAAIAFKGNEVLLTRRAAGQDLAGFWEFPGGKLETGETPAHCIVRELAEELGVRSVAGDVIAESLHTYPGGSINLIAIEVQLLDERFRLSVHDAVEFVSLSALLSKELAPADVPIAEEIIRLRSARSEAA